MICYSKLLFLKLQYGMFLCVHPSVRLCVRVSVRASVCFTSTLTPSTRLCSALLELNSNETMLIEDELLLPMLKDVSQGCRFLHAANPHKVIHGDLKAANILVDSRFRAKVADFGLSQKKQMGSTGTPFWMAPELLRGDSVNTTASDAYSYGIILYECYSRKDPYEGENAGQVLREVADPMINKRPPVPKDCPSQIAAIMRDCILADPEERPSFEELDKRLKRVDIEERKQPNDNKTSTTTTVSLFDIFPKHIAETLAAGKQVEPSHHDCVTIFFSDIVGYTELASTMEPRKVANMLDRLYSKLDSLSSTYDIFKVETIGDSYMCCSNLIKDQSDDHVKRIAEFAIEAIRAANQTLIE